MSCGPGEMAADPSNQSSGFICEMQLIEAGLPSNLVSAIKTNWPINMEVVEAIHQFGVDCLRREKHLRAQVCNAKAERDTLREILEKHASAVVSQEQLDLLRREKEEADEKVQQLTQQIAAQNEEIRGMKQIRCDLEFCLQNEAESKAKLLDIEAKKAQLQADVSKAEKSKLLAKLTDLEKERNELMEAVQTVEKESKRKVEDLQQQCYLSRGQVRQLKQNLEDADLKIGELRKQKDKINEELIEIRAKQRHSKEKQIDLEKENSKLERELSERDKQIRDLQKEVTRQKQNVPDLRKDLEETRARLAKNTSLVEDNRKLTDELNDLRVACRNMAQQILEKEKANNDLKCENENKTQELQKRIEELEGQLLGQGRLYSNLLRSSQQVKERLDAKAKQLADETEKRRQLEKEWQENDAKVRQILASRLSAEGRKKEGETLKRRLEEYQPSTSREDGVKKRRTDFDHSEIEMLCSAFTSVTHEAQSYRKSFESLRGRFFDIRNSAEERLRVYKAQGWIDWRDEYGFLKWLVNMAYNSESTYHQEPTMFYADSPS